MFSNFILNFLNFSKKSIAGIGGAGKCPLQSNGGGWGPRNPGKPETKAIPLGAVKEAIRSRKN